MVKLPDVTLIALTNKDFEGHKKAIDESCKGIEFGAVKIIWDEKCNSIDEWNKKIIKELPNYVDTSHALLIHADGYVINPDLWKDEWLGLDYIGAPWPMPQDEYSYRDEWNQIVRVGNSVSLRSKKLMDLIATRPMVEHYGNNNEDGQICCWNRQWLISQGCKFAAFEQALEFSKEAPLPENEGIKTFCYHHYE